MLLIFFILQVLQVTTGKEGSQNQQYLMKGHILIKMQTGLVWARQIRRAHTLPLGSLLLVLLHHLHQEQKVRNEQEKEFFLGVISAICLNFPEMQIEKR